MVHANIENWSIALWPQIRRSADTPQNVYARIDCGKEIALFGRAKDDPRYDPSTGEFKDGNRIVTSPITKVKNGIIYTEDSVYSPGKISEDFLTWCRQNEYDVYESIENEFDVADFVKKEESKPVSLRHICENCGKDEILTSEEAFSQGWDYPPRMGLYGIVSPRKCGSCTIDTTLWWAITCDNIPLEQLDERHRMTLKRILSEPGSIIP